MDSNKINIQAFINVFYSMIPIRKCMNKNSHSIRGIFNLGEITKQNEQWWHEENFTLLLKYIKVDFN